MAKRFPGAGADHRQAAYEYRDAMRELKNKFPDDLDAATLFAESSMNLHPWGLWMPDGSPREGTEEIVATLESVIKREPNHMGAIHYYIHAVEASGSPERALAAANRLAELAPGSGHLVHMPSHVYIRTGDYQLAAAINQKAAAADRAYIQASGAQGLYPAMYYSHNLHFIACVASMSGDYAEAKKAADMLAVHVGPLVKAMPPLEAFMTIPLAVEVRFQRWADILKTPQPSADMKVTTTYWHFARGMALAGMGKVSEAEVEYKAVVAAHDATPPDAIFAMPFNNKTKDILAIATDVLGAKIAMAKKDNNAAIGMLQEAVAIQDKLTYGEPPDWFSPVREFLGAALLMNGAAADAEKVFREDLDRNPRNPRSLFGLQQALKAQQRDYDAGLVEKRFQASWKGGTTHLKVADLL
jgi:tetratricopeptide (TPR) repeat protein